MGRGERLDRQFSDDDVGAGGGGSKQNSANPL